jgi:inhibitor of cysteine peptidase
LFFALFFVGDVIRMKINVYAGAGVLVLIIAVVLSAAILSGCMEMPADIDGNDTVVFGETYNGRTVSMETGSTFEIRLEENPTTGYGWELEVSDGLTVMEDKFITDLKVENLTGSGGVRVWTIGVNKSGDQSVSAVYRRPWENVTADEDTFTLDVMAAGDDVGTEDYVYGSAVVEDAEVQILESFPVQVHLSVSGYLPDGCTEIDEGNITQERDDFNYTVNIGTKRPADAICTQAIVPYEINVPLDVYGIDKGNYTVDVNGVRAGFELQADNRPE